MDGADDSEADDGRDGALTGTAEARGIDRSHNRDALSSEAMTDMLRDVQDAMLALDERLGALESSRDRAAGHTRQLAQGVADMGDALARRVRALEQGRQDPAPILAQSLALPAHKPARKPRQNWVAWFVVLGFIVIVALAAFWLLRAESLDRSTDTATPKAASLTPPAPQGVAAPTSASPANASPHLPPS